MTTISTSLRADLPRISYIKSIDIYVITCFGFVFAALIEYAIANFIFWSGQKRKAKEAKIQAVSANANAAHTNSAAAIHNATGPARKYRDNTYEKVSPKKGTFITNYIYALFKKVQSRKTSWHTNSLLENVLMQWW